MQINSLSSLVANAAATSGTSSTAGTSSTSTSNNSLADPNLFITLLTAQLQAQDPMDPMSPEDMVNQLTEVSSLQQLVSINQTLTNMSTGITATSTPTPSSVQFNPSGTTN